MASPNPTQPQPPGSLWTLGGLTPWQLVANVVREMDHEDFSGRASELAFNSLLALFPLMLFLLALFGLFASNSSQLEGSLLSFWGDFLPPAAYQLLSKITVELAANAGGGKLTFGIIVGLWFASGGMSSLMSTLNVAYRVRETRPWLVVRALGVALTLALSILLLSALFMVLVGVRFVDWLQRYLHWTSAFLAIWRELQWPAAALFVTASFSLIYYFGPNLKNRRWHWVTPGSIFGVVLWLAASAGFRGYLHFFNTYSTSYGSLGAVMILLVWLYATGLAFLIGGAINAEIERAASASELPASDLP
jgi:membrane protein